MWEPGVRIGPWRLLARLGTGGMGEVWRADDTSTPPRVAALKILRQPVSPKPSLQEIEDAARFEREGKVALELRHPNVVRALDFGRDALATWLAMELLEGESLQQRLARERALPPHEAVRIAMLAARGLGAAHAAGILHRDVKPGNVFLGRDGGVKMLDFGLALPLGAIGGSARLTETGIVVGTPSYMAPEQAAGERTEDVRTDVWALGAVLHHVLSGRPPFWAQGQMMGELVRILSAPPDPLPDTVPPAVSAVVSRALEKEPRARYPTIVEMAGALEDAADASSPGRVQRAAPRLREEVRFVTAILAEEVGNLSRLLEAIHRHGGHGSALLGGRAVGVFGAAEWVGDEPERAARAALEGRFVAARIGVGTGKAVIDEGSRGALTGAALAAASGALAHAVVPRADRDDEALGGSVALCAETSRRVQGRFTLDGPRLVGVAPVLRPAGRAAAAAAAATTAPLVGRTKELSALRETVERAAAESRARVALLVGPPGIGKSRLGLELWRWLAAERPTWRLVEGHGEAARAATSYGAISEALRLVAGVPEGTPLEATREGITRLVAGARLPAGRDRGTADFLGELLGAPFPENAHLRTARADRQVMADRIRLAVGDLFEAWATEGPVVLGLDDLHWMDEGSLTLVDLLARRLAAHPFAIVATGRPELLGARSERLPGTRMIVLGELPGAQTATIVQAILGRPEPAVVDRAAGNPFFAEELARWVRDGADVAALPTNVEAAVQARLDQLPAAEKNLLRRVSVLGRRFWTEAAEALGEREAGRLLPALHRRDLVAPELKPHLHGCREWTFRHGVVQEVCVGTLTPEQRRDLHARAARWLADRQDAPLEDVAEHWERAGESALARPLWVRAAVAADARGDSDKLVELARRALAPDPAVPPVEPAVEHDLRLRSVLALYWAGRVEEEAIELAALEACAAAAPGAIDPSARAEAGRRKSLHLGRRGDDDGAVQAAIAAIAFAEQSKDSNRIVRARCRLAGALMGAGKSNEAGHLAAAASALAASEGDLGTRAAAVSTLATYHTTVGRLAPAIRWLDEARLLNEAAGDTRTATSNQVAIGGYLQALGDYQGCRGTLEDSLVRVRALGMQRSEGWILHNLGLALARLGDPAAGIAAEDAAIAFGRAQDTPTLVVLSLSYRALIHLESGDIAAAERDADTGVAEAASASGYRSDQFARCVRAMVRIAQGRPEDALEDAERVLALRDEMGGMEELEIEVLLARHDAFAALGRDGDASAALAAASAAFDDKLAQIDDEHLRRTFAENIPAHARLRRMRVLRSER